MSSAQDILQGYAKEVETALESFFVEAPDPENEVVQAMKYSLLGGGKRIRAALLLAFYRLFQEDYQSALPFAGALEMIHAYSLIHDDLPCMDDDDMRRGKPSCHIAFGEATALLAGDGLLTLAFETMTGTRNTHTMDAGRILRAVQCLSSAAGYSGMIGGQVIDLAQEGKTSSPELLQRMIAKKTGALICAAGCMGIILGGGDEAAIAAANDYCGNVGLAFQIVDDILDVTGDVEELGKPIGSDAENEKCTWVTLYGLEKSKEKVLELNLAAKAALKKLPGDTSFLSELADMLARRRN